MSDVTDALYSAKITRDEAKNLSGKESEDWPIEHHVTEQNKSGYEYSTHKRAGLDWKNDGT